MSNTGARRGQASGRNDQPSKKLRIEAPSSSLFEDSKSFRYPEIPNEDQDVSETLEGDLPNLITVSRTTSTEWGNPTDASNKASMETSASANTIQLLRSYHPSLKEFSSVMLGDDHADGKIWPVVYQDDAQILHTHAGGLEIHKLPRFWTPVIHGIGFNFQESPMQRQINPRRFLNSDDLQKIRGAFPKSIGVRVLISGFCIVLFSCDKDMKDCGNTATRDNIGGLRFGYYVPVYDTTVTTNYGFAVTTKPNDVSTSEGCLGLRIRLVNGQEAITTTTHAFVKLATYGPIISRLADWYLRARGFLQSFKMIQSNPENPARAELRQPGENSPIGKTVWLAGTDHKVGVITSTYDPEINPRFPFPYGFRHDLSLITDENLPQIVNPPGFPMITSWASYSEVLDGGPVFVCRLNAMTGVWQKLEEHGTSPAAHAALIAGTEYLWDYQSFQQSATLLWRTNSDSDRAGISSGSVLCLGEMKAKTAKAVLFQNFQTPMKEWMVEGDHKSEINNDACPSFKGGFLLPREIRKAKIITAAVNGPQQTFQNPEKISTYRQERDGWQEGEVHS